MPLPPFFRFSGVEALHDEEDCAEDRARRISTTRLAVHPTASGKGANRSPGRVWHRLLRRVGGELIELSTIVVHRT